MEGFYYTTRPKQRTVPGSAIFICEVIPMEQRVERLENDRCKTCLAVAKSNIKEIREALGRIKVTKITKKSHSPQKPTKSGEKHVFVHSHKTLL